MNASPQRPDPDAILAKLRLDESRSKRGQLKVFFGMCPGVGKTYAMLRAARKEQSDGVDVLVGIVETHGRIETEALLNQLTVLPRKEMAYQGIVLKEMDLEAILQRRPSLAVVDELAHTNNPGSRHAKRWQDVVELLDAGIDVFTTINVQHIESRADAVRQITGATVHETVPDSVLDLADEIELIDLTPESLRERLKEGNVYIGERAATAAEMFFREANLIALRELALRYTAECVDRQAREMHAVTARRIVWRSGERLLVAIGASPFSTQLIRWTRRMSAALGAPWVAVYVESSQPPSPENQRLLDRNLALARELGAEVVTTHDEDVASALVRVALERNATQIVVGKSRGTRWLELLRGGSLADRLVHIGGNIDIYVVPADPVSQRKAILAWPTTSSVREYIIALGIIFAITALGLFLPTDYYLSIGLVYLLAVILLSLWVGRWPILAAGVLSALTWDYLFIPPRFTLYISKTEDYILFGTYFVVALVSGQFTARIRAQSRNERLREEHATALLQLTRALAGSKTLDEAVFAALRQVDELFGAQTALEFVGETGEDPAAHFAGSYVLDEKERSVAEWTFHNRRNAGRFTDTLPTCAGYYVPLLREDKAVGVLGIKVPVEKTLTLAQRDLLEAFARQLALIIEREHLRAASERERILVESDKLHRTLLESVSHELRTPLAVISSVTENLPNADATLRGNLIAEQRTALHRLNRLVGSLLDQIRLEGGVLKPFFDWCDATDLVRAAVENTRDALTGHPLEIVIQENMPSVRSDFALTEQALANLLLNAAHHTPIGTPVSIKVGIENDGKSVFLTVADRGPGFPIGFREQLFKKFTRGPNAPTGGLGLGLSIVRGFITAQGGDVILDDNPGGGARITLHLPHVISNNPPPE
jgi:two-component system, OmpR family, sensor histidine kinase KdpD